MAAVTAAVAGGSLLLSKLKKKKDAEKEAANNASETMSAASGGGDGSHSHGGGTSSEASDTPAAYKQFEMPGHEHPGIKQRSGAKMKSFDASGGAINGEMTDKIDTDPGSGVKFLIPGMMGGGGFGGGGAKGLMDRVMAKHKMKMGKTLNNASATPTVPPHGDESHGGGGDGGAIGVTPDAEPIPGDTTEQPALVKAPKVGAGSGAGSRGWGGAIGGGWGAMMSDKRLKENITRIGESPSGIPIYQYNYIGTKSTYKGVMAQDLLNTPHVSLHESGFYMVNYAGIDVDMELIN